MLQVTTEWSPEDAAMTNLHSGDIYCSTLHSLRKRVFSPSSANRTGIFYLSYIPAIFCLSALFIHEATLRFFPGFFTSPHSWETFCIIVFLHTLFSGDSGNGGKKSFHAFFYITNKDLHTMCRNKRGYMPFLSVFEHTIHELMLYLYSLANYSSREELNCLATSWTDVIIQL